MRQNESHRNGENPYETGIKEERDPCFAAGTDGEVHRILTGIHRHAHGSDADEPRGNRPHFFRCVVDQREQSRDEEQQRTGYDAQKRRKDDELSGVILRI